MTTATLERAEAPRPVHHPQHHEEAITGGYVPITTRQLALAWWCYREAHITARQLRVWFAAHEMRQRRAYGRTRNKNEKPVYKLEELQRLVGGRNNPRAARGLRSDLKALAALGLLEITPHAIRFAKSVDNLLMGEGTGPAFETFFEPFPNKGRTIPVPRRVIRALAAGFGRAQSATILAALVRGLFWHRSSGLYRCDGRMASSWVATTFGVSQSAVEDARAHLAELGWLQPLPAPQWLLNKYGGAFAINLDWSPSEAAEAVANDLLSKDGQPCGGAVLERSSDDTQSGEPHPGFDTQSGEPCLDRSLSTRIKTTRRLGSNPGPTGFSKEGKGAGEALPLPPPTIRDIQREDLRDTERLLELHRQAVAIDLARGGEAGKLDFLSLANRARTRGHRPGALFRWLLRQERTAWITAADEEAAAARLREHFNGPVVRESTRAEAKDGRHLSEDERLVERCICVARQHKLRDPFRVAQQGKGWTREQWDIAHLSYQRSQQRHWYAAEEEAFA